MGKEDVYESDYLENAEIFADLVNGVLYQGERVVKPEELAESVKQSGKNTIDMACQYKGNTECDKREIQRGGF